jgi:CBS domain-containing protein
MEVSSKIRIVAAITEDYSMIRSERSLRFNLRIRMATSAQLLGVLASFLERRNGMKVKDLMTKSPTACTLTNSLADAGGLMWQHDCGILPVVAEGGKVVGLITDRDICMAGVLNGRQPANIAVEDVISGKVSSCRPDDDVRVALKTMQENRIRRLAVVDDHGRLQGILSMNDIVLRAEEAKDKKVPEVSYADVVRTYQSICQHPLPMQAQAAVGV